MTLDLDAVRRRAEAATPCAPGYVVTCEGEVWSVGSNWRGYGARRITPILDRGYWKVRLSVNGERKKRSVHRLVADAYLPPRPSPHYEVRHLDGNPDNNAATNLAWGTRKENAADRETHGRTARGERNGWSRLTDDDIRELRLLIGAGWTQRAVARRMGIDRSTVFRVVHGERWWHVA